MSIIRTIICNKIMHEAKMESNTVIEIVGTNKRISGERSEYAPSACWRLL